MSRLGILGALLMLLGMSAQNADAQEPSPDSKHGPPCRGIAGKPTWAVKVMGPHVVRFVIDAAAVDTCTEYSNLEFVASLFDGTGRLLETKRFSAANDVIAGPSIRYFEFVYTLHKISSVKGIALHCRKDKLGVCPSERTREIPYYRQPCVWRRISKKGSGHTVVGKISLP
jgi:hypothetical protein